MHQQTNKTLTIKNQTDMKTNIYQIITERISEQLEKGIIPWQKPWTGLGVEDGGAINYVTRKPYSMLNQMLLMKEGEYLTYKQITALGGKLKKGAKAGMVVFYAPQVVKKESIEETEKEQEVSTYPLLRYYNVFHLDDVEGIESKIKTETVPTCQAIESAEKIINDYVRRETNLKFQNDKPSDRAYYSPATDSVVVPMLSQYLVPEEYYSTTFHELTHSTLHESRLNRKSDCKFAAFGSADYSREELVAEMGSAMLCSVAKLDCEKAFKNSVAYIQSWLIALNNDKKMIVWASSRAEKAAKYIIGKK